jgi:hypothetical protein
MLARESLLHGLLNTGTRQRTNVALRCSLLPVSCVHEFRIRCFLLAPAGAGRTGAAGLKAQGRRNWAYGKSGGLGTGKAGRREKERGLGPREKGLGVGDEDPRRAHAGGKY